jgi:hypothetical protein
VEEERGERRWEEGRYELLINIKLNINIYSHIFHEVHIGRARPVNPRRS